MKEFGDRGGAHVHFALSVASSQIDEVAARARAAGADCEGPVCHDGGDRSLYVTDLAGDRVEAWSLFAAGATVEAVSEGAS